MHLSYARSLALRSALAVALASPAAAQHVVHKFLGNARTVAMAGDVNADGFADLLVTAPFAVPLSYVRVFSGVDGAVLHNFTGSPSDRFGWSASGSGDVNNDGFDDILVGEHLSGSLDRGRILVFSGLDGSTLHAIAGNENWAELGAAVAGVGDLDGDGCDDFVAGAPHANNSTSLAGYADVYSGKTGARLHRLRGVFQSDEFGSVVAGLGDVDGDGVPDIGVSAPRESFGGFLRGVVRVYSGATGLEVMVPLVGTVQEDQLGTSLSAIGDLNNDGRQDILVGIPERNPQLTQLGRAEVFSGMDGSSLLTVHGTKPAAGFGRAVAGAGDLNSDGIPDFIVGSQWEDGNAFQSGAVRAFSGTDGSVLATVSGNSAGAAFGASLDGGRDVNGDGFPDWIAGATVELIAGQRLGAATVYSPVPLASMPFFSNVSTISVATGGTQLLNLNAGLEYGLQIYFLVGTASGTSPGVLADDILVPLNPDDYLYYSLSNYNQLPFVGTFGFLSPSGTATAALVVPDGLDPSFAGFLLHHAYVVFESSDGPVEYASNPVPLSLVP